MSESIPISWEETRSKLMQSEPAFYELEPGGSLALSLGDEAWMLVKIAEEVGGKDHHFKVIQLPYNLGMPEALAEQTQVLNGSALSFLEAAKALGLYVMASAAILQGQLTRGRPCGSQISIAEVG